MTARMAEEWAGGRAAEGHGNKANTARGKLQNQEATLKKGATHNGGWEAGGWRRVTEKAIELATRYHQGGGGRGGGGAQSPGNKLHGQEAILGEGATRKGGRRRVAEEAIKLATRCHLAR